MMRSFTARNMQEAMKLARDEMGEDAIILSSDKGDNGDLVVTFALEREDTALFDTDPRPEAGYFQSPAQQSPAPPSTHATPLLRRIEDTLNYHSTPARQVQKLLQIAQRLELPENGTLGDLESSLTHILSKAFRFDPLPLHEDGFRLMLVGPPGTGKTITAAKMAAKMVVDSRNVLVISTDSKRAAGAEQLAAFTKILGVNFEVAASRNELRAILRDAAEDARIVIDSAGCNPYDFQELKELGEYASLAGIEPVLVCSAGVDAGEAEEIASVFSFLDIERVLISRTDCARRFGSMLAASKAGDYAFCHVTSSSKVMGELKPMDAATLSHLLTHYQRERTAA